MLEPTAQIIDTSPIGDGDMPVIVAAGWIGLIWYIVVLAVCALGYFQMYVFSELLLRSFWRTAVTICRRGRRNWRLFTMMVNIEH